MTSFVFQRERLIALYRSLMYKTEINQYQYNQCVAIAQRFHLPGVQSAFIAVAVSRDSSDVGYREDTSHPVLMSIDNRLYKVRA